MRQASSPDPGSGPGSGAGTPSEAAAAYAAFDALGVAVCAVHGRQLVYVNEALAALVGRPRQALQGQPLTCLMTEAQAAGLCALHARQVQGTPAPGPWDVEVSTPLGARRLELTLLPGGPDPVMLARDVTPRDVRRAVLQKLAELGAGLPALRTEDEVLRRMFSGLEELGLAFAWLYPEGAEVRLGQTFVPPGLLPPEALAHSGRWVRNIVGRRCALLERTWQEGAAYVSDLALEATGFLDGPHADAVREALRRAGPPHAMGVRIDVEGRPRAMLVLAGHWLREEELPPVRLFGAQVSAALDAALTISRLSAQNTALAALNRLASEAASAPHPRAFFGPGTEEIIGLLGCDAVTILLSQEQEQQVELEPAYARGLEAGSEARFARLWLAGSPALGAGQQTTPRVLDAEECPVFLREELRRQGFRTVVSVPLRVRSRGVGTLGVLFRQRRQLTPLERETLQAMGSHFAAAIESHRLLDELRGRAEDMALLHEVAKALAATLELDKLLATGVTSVARIVDTPDAYVLLPDDTGEWLEVRSQTGAHPELLGLRLPMLPATSSLAALAFQSRDVVMVEDAVEDLRVNPELRHRMGGRAHLVIPLLVHERMAGVILAVETRRPRRFTPAEVERASAIANQLALALEGARLVEDLKASYVELARTQAQLVRRERLAALGELSAVVAHEVRNPLGVIFNAVANIRRIVGPDSPSVQLLDMVGEEADRLNRIVADLLTFARPPAPHPYAVPLSGLVEDAVRGALAEAAGKVHVELELHEDVPPVMVDERMMRQAFLNLAINAVQAMPQGGVLRAAVRRSPDTPEVEVEFTDTGAGISAEARARIFEPFFTTKAKGTGLGLAVVKRIFDEHRGRVILDSQPGRGTTFRLYLPLEPLPREPLPFPPL